MTRRCKTKLKRRTYKSLAMQQAYDQKMDEFVTTGMPYIGSIASSSFRDGYYERLCKRNHYSAAYACYMAGRDCAKMDTKGTA